MKEYIERKYLEDVVDYYLSRSNGAEHYAYGIIRGEVRATPSADVKEVVCGQWKYITSGEGLYECSVCNGWQYIPNDMFDFCPHCGADMRGIDNEK